MRTRAWRRKQKYLHRGKEKCPVTFYMCACTWCFYGWHHGRFRQDMSRKKHIARWWEDQITNGPGGDWLEGTLPNPDDLTLEQYHDLTQRGII